MVQKGSGSTPRGGAAGPGGRRPPRRHSPEVYRRRRIVAALAAAALLVVVVVGVVQAVTAVLGSGDPAPAPAEETGAASAAPATEDPFADFTPRPDRGGPASASPSAPEEDPVEECGPELEVRASTDQDTYAPDVEPALELTLENTGEDPCHVDAGTSQMVYEVSSGADTVFDSRHCQAGAQDREVTVDPGQELTARLPWNRMRSAAGCPEGAEPAMPGYYRLVVSLGDRSSEPVPFVLE